MNEKEALKKILVFSNIDIRELDLSVRSFSCLKRRKINTLGDLVKLVYSSPDSLLKVRNLGIRSAKEVLEKLRGFGVDLPDEYLSSAQPLATD